MGLLVEARGFFSRHIVTVVEEPDTSYQARVNLPGLIETEIASYEKQLDSGTLGNPDLIADCLARDYQVLRDARRDALRPRQKYLEWRFFYRTPQTP